MIKKSSFIVPIAATVLFSTAASAATLGTPSFTTGPATISIVNEFGPGGRFFDVGFAPYDSYSVSVSTTVASSFGLPSLVGQSLTFSYGVENGLDFLGTYSLKIAGVEVLSDSLFNTDSFLFYPPIASIDFGPAGSFDTFNYDDPFADFGPRTTEFPEFEMSFLINDLLPNLTGYEQCNMAGVCEFSTTPLSSIDGLPVTVSESYEYVEGQINDGTLTFYTPGGPPPAPIPLPAGSLLLIGALSALGAFGRRKKH